MDSICAFLKKILILLFAFDTMMFIFGRYLFGFEDASAKDGNYEEKSGEISYSG